MIFQSLAGIQKGAQNFPVILPVLDAGGILLAPGIGKSVSVFRYLVQYDGGIDLLRGGNDLVDIFIADMPDGTANLDVSTCCLFPTRNFRFPRTRTASLFWTT